MVCIVEYIIISFLSLYGIHDSSIYFIYRGLTYFSFHLCIVLFIVCTYSTYFAYKRILLFSFPLFLH